ncbi:MAG TPA: DUF2239 family protein [Rhodanobacteraceae bacterium]|nr:DUF2239 family protein [Rhodanobacteraceae bacterium]
MHPNDSHSCTAFDGQRLLASGSVPEVALAAKAALDAGSAGPVLILDDASSLPVEVDFRGTPAEMLARLHAANSIPADTTPRGPGRPKLGVTAREVTLLPRHWDWLGRQPGGASAALRRLVEDARRSDGNRDRARLADEATDRFLRVMGGDLPGYEDATRAFWRGDRQGFAALIEPWPADLRHHLALLAAIAWDERAAA